MKRIALVALGVAALVAVSASSGASARWKLIPKQFIGGYYGLSPLGWASGRAWFVKSVQSGTQIRFELVSARVGAGGLRSFRKSPFPGQQPPDQVIHGSSILVRTQTGPTEIARLGSDGKLGEPRPIPGDPEAKAQELFKKDIGWWVVAGARVGGRAVWVLEGALSVGLGARPYMAACCSESGKARDLTSLLVRKKTSVRESHILGVDGKGRLWLFWNGGGALRAVQLDPGTLAPGAAHTAAGAVFQLACAAVCRAVFESARRNIVSWAGTGLPTKVLPTLFGFAGAHCRPLAKCGTRTLEAIGYRGSRLAVAYSMNCNCRPPSTAKVGIGNAKGRRLRTASSATVPSGMSVMSALSTPRGVVFLAGQWGPSANVSKVRAAVLR